MVVDSLGEAVVGMTIMEEEAMEEEEVVAVAS